MHILHNPVGVQECTFKMVEYCPDENITAVDQEQEVVPPQETTMFSLFYIYFYFVSLLVFSLGEAMSLATPVNTITIQYVTFDLIKFKPGTDGCSHAAILSLSYGFMSHCFNLKKKHGGWSLLWQVVPYLPWDYF